MGRTVPMVATGLAAVVSGLVGSYMPIWFHDEADIQFEVTPRIDSSGRLRC
ncbi:hypothetical protein Plhal304r1_c016g0057581 [Plasmopara halstedii]